MSPPQPQLCTGGQCAECVHDCGPFGGVPCSVPGSGGALWDQAALSFCPTCPSCRPAVPGAVGAVGGRGVRGPTRFWEAQSQGKQAPNWVGGVRTSPAASRGGLSWPEGPEHLSWHPLAWPPTTQPAAGSLSQTDGPRVLPSEEVTFPVKDVPEPRAKCVPHGYHGFGTTHCLGSWSWV